MTEIEQHNNKIVASLGGDGWKDIRIILNPDGFTLPITGKMELVERPEGENQFEECGIFTAIYVKQWTVGMDGDSFEGYIFCKFLTRKWLKIPYAC